MACENGHIRVAQWLYEIRPTIYTSDDYGYVFEMSCENISP
jgi:hypothetical protein